MVVFHRNRNMEHLKGVVSLEVSVVICAYTETRWGELLASLNSVQSQTYPAREVIVVIDHNPALLERLRAQRRDITVIANQEARGLSGARNTGISAARGEIIAFMDEDATAEPDWLACLVAAYTHPSVLGAGGAVEPVWLAGRPGWFPEEFDWVVGCTYRGLPRSPATVRNLIGCNMSLRREVFQQVGGFRTDMGRIGTLPVGCEETELCIRALQRWPAGELVYNPSAKVHHRVPATRGSARYFFSRCYSEGLSKAQVARWVGSQAGLASERTYTFHTLPRGFLHGWKDVIFHRQIAGLGRAFAILSGLLVTTAGYLRGRITGPTVRRHENPNEEGSLYLENRAK